MLNPAKAFPSLLVASTLMLSACGGSSGSSDDNSGISTGGGSEPEWVAGEFTAYPDLAQQCSADGTGSDLIEKLWLRSWTNDTYLWYDEVDDINPDGYSVEQYFNLLVTDELSETGNPKDNFHFSMSSQEWNQLVNSGASFGYGMNYFLRNASSSVSRQVTISYTEPNSPATTNNIARGAIIVSIDGVNVANANTQAEIDVLNAGLFPTSSSKQTEFVIRDLNSQTDRSVSLTAASIVSTPVQNVKTLSTATGNVGYLQFNSHIATAEKGLFDAITQLSNAGVDDLVIDLRYNDGGLLAMASQLGYMVAGDNLTANKTFELMNFNDKYPNTDPVTGGALSPVPFIPVTLGFNSALIGQNIALPSLDLDRVFILTTGSTCSASEALMNGLRGIDVEVIQIGDTTCGKPYGFYPTDNCDTTYFTIQFQGVNDKGFGDYADGFMPSTNPMLASEVPGCLVGDDFTHALGDAEEAMLSAALYYRDNSQCPMVAAASVAKAPAINGLVDESLLLQDTRKQSIVRSNRILSHMSAGQ